MLENITKDEERVLLQSLINGLMHDPRANAWEKEFLVSINQQLVSRELSEKQISVLNKIKQKCRAPAE